jgi:hypothetical protein
MGLKIILVHFKIFGKIDIFKDKFPEIKGLFQKYQKLEFKPSYFPHPILYKSQSVFKENPYQNLPLLYVL